MTARFVLAIASLFGFLSVAFGAFGSHSLKPYLIQQGRLDVYQIAVEYQFFHTLALFGVGILMSMFPYKQNAFRYASLCFIVGIILFSGSLYLLALIGLGMLGFLTPIGGVFFLVGWGLVTAGVLKK
jgi:uncharacterized membrane protein YgdD (TMEM256/DUF423 family)